MRKLTKSPIRRNIAQGRAGICRNSGAGAARLNAQQEIVVPPAAAEKPAWSKHVLWINHPGMCPPDRHH